MLVVMYMHRTSYMSLDVNYTVLFYNHTFRERDAVRACCNIFFGVVCNTAYSRADSVHFWDEACPL